LTAELFSVDEVGEVGMYIQVGVAPPVGKLIQRSLERSTGERQKRKDYKAIALLGQEFEQWWQVAVVHSTLPFPKSQLMFTCYLLPVVILPSGAYEGKSAM
jgi:hypothetical protein